MERFEKVCFLSGKYLIFGVLCIVYFVENMRNIWIGLAFDKEMSWNLIEISALIRNSWMNFYSLRWASKYLLWMIFEGNDTERWIIFRRFDEYFDVFIK